MASNRGNYFNVERSFLLSNGLDATDKFRNLGIHTSFGFLFKLVEFAFKVLFFPLGVRWRSPCGFRSQGSLTDDAKSAVRRIR